MSVLDGAKVRWREWREQVADRKAAAKAARAHDPHGHSRFWLLNVPATATICAAIVEWYWAVLFCIEATGHVDWNWETGLGSGQPATSVWNFAFSAHLPVLIGLMCATAPIVMISMVWLPVQFTMRGSGRWRRGTMIAVGLLANVLVIVSGTVVMNYNRQEQVRDALVVEQSAEAQRGVLTANVQALEAELATLMNHRSTYIATAASVGAEEYERSYVAQARATNDPRLPLLERALGSARRADTLRAEIREARITAAQAAPAAATAANVEDRVGVGLNTFAQYVEVYRPPFIALICTLVGVFGAWWVVALMEHLNPRDVLRSGWADEAHRIEDKSAETPIPSQPMKPPREVVTDADTGEELVKVAPRPYWRKRKGQAQKLAIEPEIPPDERGVETDGGARTAVAPTGPIEMPSEVAPTAADSPADQEHERQHDARRDNSGDVVDGDASVSGDTIQPEPPELSDAELAAIDAELADEAQPADEQPADAEPEHGVEQADADADQRTEPETDPSRMIAAE